MSTPLTPVQIRQALERSGYLMEQRICPVIERHGYAVTPNHVYEDPDTGKSREVDIHALSVRSVYRKTYKDLFSPTFLVSCKNNHLPVVLFSHRNIVRGVPGMTPIAKAGYPLDVQTHPESDSVEEYLKFEQFHHYYRAERVASQYCRLIEKKQGSKSLQYIAEHGDLYSDLESLIKAVNAERFTYIADELYLNKLSAEATEEDINFVPIYPVFILADQLYECVQTRRSVRIRGANHIVFVQRTESRLIKATIHVDFIRESYLNRYLNLIEEECNEIQKRLRAHRKVLRQNALREMRTEKENADEEALSHLLNNSRTTEP